MKKWKKLQRLIREVINLIVKFLKPYGLQDEMLSIPKSVRQMGFKVGFMNLGMTVITLTFAFMLKGTNMLIEYKLIFLGIVLFMLYRGQQVVKEAFHLFENSESKKFELILEKEIIFRGSQIIGNTSEKVLKFDPTSKIYKIMSNEAVLNSIKNYLQNLWRQKIQHTFNVFEIISVVAMLIVAIATNSTIPQFLFIPLILGFMLISFFSSAYIGLNRKAYYRKHRECNNKQSETVNDLLRVPVIVKHDLKMRIDKLQKILVESNENVMKFYKKMNLSRLFTTMIEAFSQYGVIIFYLLGVEWSKINLSTITEITATLLIVETALGYIRRIAGILNNHNERLTILEKEEKDMLLILEVFHNENNRSSKPKTDRNINIEPFYIQRMKESENDNPFSLELKKKVNINVGDIVILSGPSGSGKSTFMKLLTGQIRLKKSTEIPSTSRFLFYDEKLKFGILSIFEELFCCCENPNLDKMQEILENLHLWSEIKSNCFDVWKWMKEKQFEQSLSNGQKQRLILAKMLYWLDDGIDIMVLDECTSGLDDKSTTDSADAERILEYIVRYCNKDKERIVIISTHQNIDGFKRKLDCEYTIRNLQFVKGKDGYLVREI